MIGPTFFPAIAGIDCPPLLEVITRSYGSGGLDAENVNPLLLR